MISRRAIFLDRDGVLNADLGYVYRVQDLEILPNVGAGLQELKKLGFLLIVVTNQSGVARGYFSLEAVDDFNRALSAELWARSSVQLDDFFVCPHLVEGAVARYSIACVCRKPATGLLDQAVEKWGIDLAESYLIGDKPSDIALATNAGIPGIQILANQYGVSSDAACQAQDLLAAANFIRLRMALSTEG